VKITSKGQVTIPKEVREALGFLPNTEVEFVVEGTTARVRKSEGRQGAERGAAIVRRLRGTASTGLTTDEIMALTRGEP
jgi:AbrB family looped-hinge helix DNA binding protein